MLDVKTVAITYFVTSLMLTVVMTVLWLQNRKQFNGILFFAACVALQTTGFLLIASQKVIHPFFSILIANTLIALAPFLLYLGLERFFDYRHSQRRNYIILAVFIGFYTYFTHIRPDVGTRIGLISIVVAVMFLQISWFILYRIDSRFKPITRAAGILFLLFSLVQIYRLTLTFFIPAGGDYLSIHASDTTAQIINQVLAIAMVFALVLMINNRSLQVIREKEDLLVSSRVEMEISNREMAELKRAQEELKQAEDQLKLQMMNLDAIFESSPVAMFVIDDTTNIVMTNLAFTVLCGGSESDILQHRPGNALRCVHSHSDPRGCGYSETCKYCNVRNGVEGLIANGGSLHGAELELELMRNGEPGKYWMNIGVEPLIMNGQGHWCISMTDITERKLPERELHDNELKYRALFETSNDANLLFADGLWVDCNASAARIFGCTREQIIGAHPSRFSPPTQPDGRSSEEEAVKLINLAYTTGPQFFEWEHCRADGTTFAAEVSLNRLDLGGKPYMQAIVRDVSERKRAEESNALNSQRIQTLLQLNQMQDATLQEITDYVLEEAVRLTQSTIGYLAFLNEDESVLTMHSWSKSAMAQCAIQDKPIIYPVATTGLWGEAVRQRRPVYTNDYAAANPLKKGYPQGHVAVKRHMNVPVFEGSRIVIVAGVGNKNGKYDESDASQLTLIMESMWRMLERMRTEDKLKRSEEQYREAQAMGHTGHWQFDPVSQEFFGSPEAMRIYGFPGITTVKFDDIANCVSKAEVERVVQALFGLIQDGKEFNEEFEICPRNSSEIRVLNSVAQMQKDEHGNPRLVSGILQDITERKKADEVLRKTIERLGKAVGTTINVLVSAIEMRDPYTAGHQLRVADIARSIATEMGLPQDKIDGIRMAGSIHDIGKLSIPAEILSKPTKLTEIELSLIKEHSRKGYEMLKDVESSWPLAEIVYQHHERMDGSGYPRKLKGDDILMEARILIVADVVEAMASHRPYRPGLGIDEALEEIEKNRGTHYDNTVADACLRLFREKGYHLT